MVPNPGEIKLKAVTDLEKAVRDLDPDTGPVGKALKKQEAFVKAMGDRLSKSMSVPIEATAATLNKLGQSPGLKKVAQDATAATAALEATARAAAAANAAVAVGASRFAHAGWQSQARGPGGRFGGIAVPAAPVVVAPVVPPAVTAAAGGAAGNMQQLAQSEGAAAGGGENLSDAMKALAAEIERTDKVKHGFEINLQTLNGIFGELNATSIETSGIIGGRMVSALESASSVYNEVFIRTLQEAKTQGLNFGQAIRNATDAATVAVEKHGAAQLALGTEIADATGRSIAIEQRHVELISQGLKPFEARAQAIRDVTAAENEAERARSTRIAALVAESEARVQAGNVMYEQFQRSIRMINEEALATRGLLDVQLAAGNEFVQINEQRLRSHLASLDPMIRGEQALANTFGVTGELAQALQAKLNAMALAEADLAFEINKVGSALDLEKAQMARVGRATENGISLVQAMTNELNKQYIAQEKLAMQGQLSAGLAQKNPLVQQNMQAAREYMDAISPRLAAEQAFGNVLGKTGSMLSAVTAGNNAYAETNIRLTETVRRLGTEMGMTGKQITNATNAVQRGVPIANAFTAAGARMGDAFDKTNSILATVGTMFAGLFVISRIVDTAKKLIGTLVELGKEGAKYQMNMAKFQVIAKNVGAPMTELGKAVELVSSRFITQQTAIEGLGKLLQSGLPLDMAVKRMREFEESILTTDLATKSLDERLMKSIEGVYDRMSRTVGINSGMQTNFGQAMRINVDILDDLTDAQKEFAKKNTLAGESIKWSSTLSREFATVSGVMAAAISSTTGQLALMDKQVTQIRQNIGIALANVLGGVAKLLNEKLLPAIIKWTGENPTLIRTIGMLAAAMAALIVVLGVAFMAVIQLIFAFSVTPVLGWVVIIGMAISVLIALLPAIVGPTKALRFFGAFIGALAGEIIAIGKVIVGLIKIFWGLGDQIRMTLVSIGALAEGFRLLTIGDLPGAYKLAKDVISGWDKALKTTSEGADILGRGLVGLWTDTVQGAREGVSLIEQIESGLKAIGVATGSDLGITTVFGKAMTKAATDSVAKWKSLLSTFSQIKDALLDMREKLRGMVADAFFDSGSFQAKKNEFEASFNEAMRTFDQRMELSRERTIAYYKTLPAIVAGLELSIKKSKPPAMPEKPKAPPIPAPEFIPAHGRPKVDEFFFSRNDIRRAEDSVNGLNNSLKNVAASAGAIAPAVQKPLKAIADSAKVGTTGLVETAKGVEDLTNRLKDLQAHPPMGDQANAQAMEQWREQIDAAKASLAELQKSLKDKPLVLVEGGKSPIEKSLDEIRAGFEDVYKKAHTAYLRKIADENIANLKDITSLSLESANFVGQAQARIEARVYAQKLKDIDLIAEQDIDHAKEYAKLKVDVEKAALLKILEAQSSAFRFLVDQIRSLSQQAADEIAKLFDFQAREQERLRKIDEEASKRKQIWEMRQKDEELINEINKSAKSEKERAMRTMEVRRQTELEIQRLNEDSAKKQANVVEQVFRRVAQSVMQSLVRRGIEALVEKVIIPSIGGLFSTKAQEILGIAKADISLGQQLTQQLAGLESLKDMLKDSLDEQNLNLRDILQELQHAASAGWGQGGGAATPLRGEGFGLSVEGEKGKKGAGAGLNVPRQEGVGGSAFSKFEKTLLKANVLIASVAGVFGQLSGPLRDLTRIITIVNAVMMAKKILEEILIALGFKKVVADAVGITAQEMETKAIWATVDALNVFRASLAGGGGGGGSDILGTIAGFLPFLPFQHGGMITGKKSVISRLGEHGTSEIVLPLNSKVMDRLAGSLLQSGRRMAPGRGVSAGDMFFNFQIDTRDPEFERELRREIEEGIPVIVGRVIKRRTIGMGGVA